MTSHDQTAVKCSIHETDEDSYEHEHADKTNERKQNENNQKKTRDETSRRGDELGDEIRCKLSTSLFF